ncbi:hypothetical protein IWQ60_001106 [Tieghemiomyces parasiticus]|uniref:RING-type domain-containing protein n=1 Tax=Tieghemiomyces parasiticus TaxID=78921 RepID=A0A9W8ALM2_9FUNG|nr:hypothetical protein IWQ60_001106 [Tieghemiomyces parasiticus]
MLLAVRLLVLFACLLVAPRVRADDSYNITLNADVVTLSKDVSSVVHNSSTFPSNLPQGLLFKYLNRPDQVLTSPLGYVALINWNIIGPMRNPGQYVNRNLTNFSLGYSRTDDNPCRRIALATTTPCFEVHYTMGLQLETSLSQYAADNTDSADPNAGSAADPSVSQNLFIRLNVVNSQTGEVVSPSVLIVSRNNTGLIVGAVLGSLFGLILLGLMSFCIHAILKRRRLSQHRRARREEGIETLHVGLNKEATQPLDPALLKHIRLINTQVEDVRTLEQPAPAGPLPDIPAVECPPYSETDRAVGLGNEEEQVDENLELGKGRHGDRAPKQTADEKWAATPPPPAMSNAVASSDIKQAPDQQAHDIVPMAKLDKVCGNPDTTTETCPICLDDIERGQLVRQLPCNHVYHVECIDEWLTEKASVCPTCKYDCAPYCIQQAGPSYQPPAKPVKAPGGNQDQTIYIY